MWRHTLNDSFPAFHFGINTSHPCTCAPSCKTNELLTFTARSLSSIWKPKASLKNVKTKKKTNQHRINIINIKIPATTNPEQLHLLQLGIQHHLNDDRFICRFFGKLHGLAMEWDHVRSKSTSSWTDFCRIDRNYDDPMVNISCSVAIGKTVQGLIGSTYSFYKTFKGLEHICQRLRCASNEKRDKKWVGYC